MKNLKFIFFAVLIIVFVAIGCTSKKVDHSRNSENIYDYLELDEEYPYIGFWKKDCSLEYGMAIEKVGDGFYSVSFCGKGGAL